MKGQVLQGDCYHFGANKISISLSSVYKSTFRVIFVSIYYFIANL
ncbi:hypothetical protein HMPREF3226_01541 [Prevotella corporis]|uniref:Uncharacterized protein n=1 Tax=Prevotella corporis TaxID=28128 RepID=A0A133Q713_9BACT|nr:hypothetical protein HMPREF3226_01541 [Prevotella corporis]